jgi:sulfite exporter TauE/SafE
MTSVLSLSGQGFLLGLAMGTTCLVTCGPIYSSYLLQHNRSFSKGFLAVLELSVGRLITYAAVGAIAGAIGTKATMAHRPTLGAIAYILSAAILILSTIATFRLEKLCSFSRFSAFARNPFLLGMATGINLCPSFLVAFTKAVFLSGAAAGIIFFISFFAGTSIYMLPLSALSVLSKRKLFRVLGGVAAIGVSIWLLISAAQTLCAGFF